jgi:hypothetical protein
MKSNLSHRNKNFMLIFYESFIDKQDAIKRERYLKSSKGKISLRNILKNTLYRVGGSPRSTFEVRGIQYPICGTGRFPPAAQKCIVLYRINKGF